MASHPNPMSCADVRLNSQDTSLSLQLSPNGSEVSPMTGGGFAYLWSGSRATVGGAEGRYYFTVKLTGKQPVKLPGEPENRKHLARIGVSVLSSDVNCLGEVKGSYGYGGTGKASSDGKFFSYGKVFGVGDEVGCAVDFDSTPATVSYTVNGEWLGKAFDLPPAGNERALFPHVLTKNIVLQVSFASGITCPQGVEYAPWQAASKVSSPQHAPLIPTKAECEVMMMVGLPASGKSWWIQRYVADHPEKRYVVLGTNNVMDQMKVTGLSRKRNYAGRFKELMDQASGVFSTLLKRAPDIARNYIIDQTNVYPRARSRKMAEFQGFKRIAVVVAVDEQTLQQHTDKREQEEGKTVPKDAVDEMSANFVLPDESDKDVFDEIRYVVLPQADACATVARMREAAKKRIADHKRKTRDTPHSSQPIASEPGLNSFHQKGNGKRHQACSTGNAPSVPGYNTFDQGATQGTVLVHDTGPGGRYVPPCVATIQGMGLVPNNSGSNSLDACVIGRNIQQPWNSIMQKNCNQMMGIGHLGANVGASQAGIMAVPVPTQYLHPQGSMQCSSGFSANMQSGGYISQPRDAGWNTQFGGGSGALNNSIPTPLGFQQQQSDAHFMIRPNRMMGGMQTMPYPGGFSAPNVGMVGSIYDAPSSDPRYLQGGNSNIQVGQMHQGGYGPQGSMCNSGYSGQR